jgi:outer membrane protein assembly factor BamD
MPRSFRPSARREVSTLHSVGQAGRDRVALGQRVVMMLVLAAALAACRGGFRLERFGGETGPLFKAGLAELSLRHWGNAIMAFEKLTTDLPARDSLLPLSHYYLGKARSGNSEHLLAAQAFNKVSENFPDDSLADDAMYESAHEYQLLWRSPELDSQYGVTSQAAYRTLVAVYPDSPRRKDAERELAKLEEMFATKEYLAGYYYFRRKAYDPAILYFKTVVNTFPETRRARDAYLRMIESYRVIRYVEEAADACVAVKKGFGDDPEVKKLCPPVAAPRDSASARPAAPARDTASAKPAVPLRTP